MSAQTRGPVNTIYGTVGATPVSILTFIQNNYNVATNFLQIQNTHATQYLAYTFDGAVPACNGNGNTLPPYWSEQMDVYVINGPKPLMVVGSGSGTTFTIKYA